MRLKYRIDKGTPYPMGVTAFEDRINIAIAFTHRPKKDCGILLYDGKKMIARISFSESYMTGLLYAVSIIGIDAEQLCYQFFLDDEVFVDAYAKRISGREKWGKYHEKNDHIKGQIGSAKSAFDWEGDACLHIPYEDSILYSLHVRGFTKHVSSGVQSRGTFEGLTEKIPYLKELGINGILCMPFYEFDEIIKNPVYQEIPPKIQEFMSENEPVWKYHINYWGFGDQGNFYMAPKASYAADAGQAEISLRRMVRQMHRNGIEVLMQIYFAPDQSPDFIRDVLRFWVAEYHIDGFQLLGVGIPVRLLAQDPLLGRTKLICEQTDDAGRVCPAGRGYERNLARYSDGFRADCRRFLKGDENMLYPISRYMMENSAVTGVVHHVTDYRGFTLQDLFSYERKHNEANGEKNRDGSDFNFSWNCGQEGTTRKKTVLALRLMQRKNAMILLLLAQATPLLLAGDEFGHSAGGNNNAYCQDNKTNWLNWNIDETNRQFLDFVKKCIAFRKSHPILHRKEEMKLLDTISCGYPDVSFHSDQAWFTRFESYSRHLGVMYCGLYEMAERGPDDFIYLAMNMHWTDHEFALPKLPTGYRWHIAFSTKESAEEISLTEDKERNGIRVSVQPRSIVVLAASEVPNMRKKEKRV